MWRNHQHLFTYETTADFCIPMTHLNLTGRQVTCMWKICTICHANLWGFLLLLCFYFETWKILWKMEHSNTATLEIWHVYEQETIILNPQEFLHKNHNQLPFRIQKNPCTKMTMQLLRHGWRRLMVINLLKPTGYVMHQQFNIQQLYALPTLYLCVLYLSENKQRLVPLTA
jgi:hypothetical protein